MTFKSRYLSLALLLCLTGGIAQPTRCYAIDVDSAEASAKPSPQARKLAEKVVDAYGGIDKLKNLNELMYRAKGTVKESSMISGAENAFECDVYARGDKTRVELNVLGQSVVTGYNGSASWVKQGENVFPTDPTTAKHIQLEVEHGLKLLEKMADKNAFIALGEPQAINGKTCQTLLVKAVDGKFSRFSIDPNSYLVLRNEYGGIDLEQGLKASKSNDYSDYRPVFGTQLPFKTIEYNDDKKCSETNLSTIDLVLNGNDSIFDMPVEIPIARLKQGPVKLPFEYRANEIMLKTRINDKSDVLLILDTGATTSVLNASDATTFGTTKSTDFKMTTGSGAIKTSYIHLSSMAFGDLRLENIPVAVSELSGFKELPGQKPVGIIGADILRRFLVTIDYENNQVIFADPHLVTVPADALSVPTEPALGAAGLVVQGRLDGQPITMLVDTGAAFNNVSEHLVQKLIKAPLLPVGKVEGLDGQKVSIGAVMFKNLKIGPVSHANPVFSVAPHGVSGLPKGIIVDGALAILGNPFWSQYTLTIDYRNQRLLLQRSKTRQQLQDVAEAMQSIEEKYWRSHDASATATQFEDLGKKLEQKNSNLGASLCYAKAGLYAGMELKNFDTAHASDLPDKIKAINSLFQKATQLAVLGKNKTVIAQVLSMHGTYLLRYALPPDQVTAKKLLGVALSYAPADAQVSLGCYWLAKQLKLKSANQIVDQVLMTEPNNWEALWERYEDAKVSENRGELVLVADQLRRYYSGTPEVEVLDTVSGAKTN